MILGIDQGTTGTRAIAMDDGGGVIARAYRAHAQHRPRDGWVEHDPEEIWRNLVACAAEAAELARAAGGGRVAAIGLANQGETCLLWDAATLRPFGRALVWQDTRAADGIEQFAPDEDAGRRLRETTGLRLDAYFSAPKLRWLLDHQEGAAAARAAGRLRAGTLDAWLLAKLCGAAATDASTAARTLLYDVRALGWDPWLCERFGVPADILPTVRESVAPFGEARGIGAGVDGAEVAASLVDQPAAMVGEGCLEPGDTKATFGTGCFVYTNTGEELRPVDGLLATIAWRRDGRTTHALDGGILAAGTVAGWLRDVGLAGPGDAGLDAACAPSTDVVCVPALVGLGAPHWDRAARAAWLGIGAGTTRGELVRAAIDGVAFRIAEVLDAMPSVRALKVDGGLTGSTALMQSVADLSGIPLDLSDEPEATACGAAALAARGINLWTSDDPIRARVRHGRRVDPRLSDADRATRRDRFRRALTLVRAFGR